jgi:multidrug resistance efflux pump
MKGNIIKYAVTLIVVVVAALAALTLYRLYLANPWTRDGQVRANVVGIAPRISGPVIQVAVHDNQQVKKGDLLFEIDPTDFAAQVEVATGQLSNAEANLKQREQEVGRQSDLYQRKVSSQQEYQNAQDAYQAGQAQVASAKANLDLAKLNLSYTKLLAPVDGYITNMNTSAGTWVSAGQRLTALVDTNSFWVAAYFKETQLPDIQPGQKARITLMGYRRQPFTGIVRSVGWGIFVQDGSGGSGTDMLPSINPTIDWIRLPQRFPVRIQVEGKNPVPLRIGQTASVAVIPESQKGHTRSSQPAQP